MAKFGLIGKDIDYSFSRSYFKNKFETNNLQHEYVNFDIPNINQFPEIIKENSNLKGFNVTIPYKESIIPFLDKLNKKAKKIGAVNTIKISNKGILIGYNTDAYGFKKSLKKALQPHHKKALILGTGGASKAIAFALESLQIPFKFVSRTQKDTHFLTYDELTEDIISDYQIIINCTPLGTYPNVDSCPDIPYAHLSQKHLLFDLIYNPSETLFLKQGKQKGASTLNGLKMLEYQAEKSWRIWNK